MAIIQGLVAGVARAGGKILNTAFGWANLMLFGKVPKDRQLYLSIITFGSVIWIVVVIGVSFPSFGAWLLTFAKLPRWVNYNWIRIAMLVAAVIIPPIVGFVALKTVDEQDRQKDVNGKALAILKVYPYTLGLAVTRIMLTIFAPILCVRTAAKRWTPEH